MKIESQVVTIEKSAQETFDFLNKIENFEKLMPDSISKFEVLGEDKFLFALKGMPEIVLKKKEATPPNKIVLGAGGGKIDFNLIGFIEATGDASSEVRLVFEGDFNPMMAMMIKNPITKFIETLAENLPKSV